MKRWFHVAYFADDMVQRALNEMIFVLNPHEKMPAHLTLRGPFKSAHNARQYVFDLYDHQITILGAGRFPYPQTTVFLQCGSEAVKERWWKPDYPGFNPHITIYNGPSYELADKVFSILQRYRLFARTPLGPVQIYESVSGQRDFTLRLSIDFEDLSRRMGLLINETVVESLPIRERIACFERLVGHLRAVLGLSREEKWA